MNKPAPPPTSENYHKIALAICYIRDHLQQQPSLEQIATHIGLSPHYTQRLFQQWAGLSPKAFLQFLTRQSCLTRLSEGEDVLNTSLASGLSSPSRLHDLCLHWDAMTPGSVRRKGQGLHIEYSWQPTLIGRALLATTDRGLCYLDFSEQDCGEAELLQRWPNASFQHSHHNPAHQKIASQLFLPHRELQLHIIGSPFQHKVWEALIRLPAGQLTSYGQLASAIGKTGASRAVGTAVAQNPIGLLIPCHRVIRQDGDIGNYHWGCERKAALLLHEQS
ncbi:methylated-DNA--[protein]-cysteine S-methyltransferase [Maricurvus nonylphenolicus]|uniref:methylated-DNA--[protein]-cysteine S-methyltransferase n=1 Tax=Maricurvus nonylphenolicus TaxID=1008307 RepID=UPI0036F31118